VEREGFLRLKPRSLRLGRRQSPSDRGPSRSWWAALSADWACRPPRSGLLPLRGEKSPIRLGPAHLKRERRRPGPRRSPSVRGRCRRGGRLPSPDRACRARRCGRFPAPRGSSPSRWETLRFRRETLRSGWARHNPECERSTCRGEGLIPGWGPFRSGWEPSPPGWQPLPSGWRRSPSAWEPLPAGREASGLERKLSSRVEASPSRMGMSPIPLGMFPIRIVVLPLGGPSSTKPATRSRYCSGVGRREGEELDLVRSA
jgi:hypothetical protein